MNKLRLITLLVLTTALSAATLAAPASTTAPSAATTSATAQPGYITGVVTDEQGKPIPNVEIVADNTLAYDSNLKARTDAQGRYKIDVRKAPVTFKVFAYLSLSHDGYSATVDLVPENPDVVPGGVGGVRNFVYKPKPTTRDDPFGNLGLVYVERTVGEYDVDPTKVVVTLTPVGKLADGTTPKPRSATPLPSGGGPVIGNVMWGTYKVTATLNGQPLEIRRRIGGFEQFEWGMSYTGGFTKDYYAVRPSMFLEVRSMRPGRAASQSAPTQSTQAQLPPARSTATQSVPSSSISGTLRADVDLKGTVVLACVEKNGECDETMAGETTITTSGRSARYEIEGLQAGVAYSLVAWKDMNGDGEVNPGDLIGMFGADSGGQAVTAPASGLELTLVAMP
ncbi:carboxypeptidase-like regulatory domain-containing protein [Deinococcus yavapaiensis]|uniref:Carboxypeptidase family protein n=1 Tax=Deinococcus yavapaiensis KR-236 TaxID=694435 RepID=A0A318SLP9_9DEIO|nr:carboxypeptidase-like regulatory domain-containing protein [Deinococcus yavapaiensis]PYE55459.1 carboxypeptidase family protein [Deinococcus yavapaiensis KR-236]